MSSKTSDTENSSAPKRYTEVSSPELIIAQSSTLERHDLAASAAQRSDAEVSAPQLTVPQGSTSQRSDGSDEEQKTSRCSTFLSFWSCPPSSPLSTIVSSVLVLGLIYGALVGLMGREALPGGAVFGTFALLIVCYLGGQCVRLIKLPTLVGMMVVGFLLRNVPGINIADDIPTEWAGNIRNMALTLVLLRAGLEIEEDVLIANKLTCCKLIFIPFIGELCMGALLSRCLLEMPWLWSFLTGATLSAVSPAVVLPVVLELERKGFGLKHGLPTLVIAVAGIDDVLALAAFEIFLGIIFAQGSVEWAIAKGPLEMLVGIIYGVVLGVVSWYLPNPEEKSVSVLRFLLLVSGGMFVLFGSHAVEWGAAGALGCICLPFIADIRWGTHADVDNNPVGDSLTFVWKIIEPALFGLVGTEIQISYLQPMNVGMGLATLFMALATRMGGSMVAGLGAGLSLREKIFITLAGLPKATVQAAIAPVALNMAKTMPKGSEGDMEQHGIKVLTVAVLAIFIAAPLGASAIAMLAPKLLVIDSEPKSSVIMKPIDKRSIVAVYDV